MAEVRLAAPVKAVRVDDVEDAAPGAFEFYTRSETGPDVMRGLIYVCPCGCGQPRALAFHPLAEDDQKNGRHGWTWDGNRETPTLSPSILSHEGGTREGPTHWHGHLQAGFFVQA